MADSFHKKEREKKKRKRKKDKAEKRKQKKLEGIKPPEFMYLDEDGNFSTEPTPESKKRKFNVEDIVISTPKKEQSDVSGNLAEGVVKFYNFEKHFGFIKELHGNNEYFVHGDDLVHRIKEGDKVTFEKSSGPKGFVAQNVKVTA